MRLRALLAFGVILAALAPFGARAAPCPVPFTFVNGTLADGTQVNANFAAVEACIAAGGGGAPPGGGLYSTQYNLNTMFGGSGPGIAGQVMTSNGPSLPPSFQATGASFSVQLAPNFTNNPGTYNAGGQTLVNGNTLSGQDKMQPQTINYTIVYPNDTGTTQIAAGVSGPITFTLRNPNSATAFTTSPTFQDGTGFGFTLTTVSGTATLTGTQPGIGGTSITFPPGSVVTCTDTATTYVCSTITPVWNVISPTNTAADQAVLQNAVNGPAPVFMTAGRWDICQEVDVPSKQVVEGVYINGNEGSNAISINNFATVLNCPTGFTSGAAYISTGDRTVIRGVAVFGSTSDPSGTSCFRSNSTAYPSFFYDVASGCNGWGIDNSSNGPGPSQSFSQGITLAFNYIVGNQFGGYFADGTNGGFVSDQQIGPQNEFEVNGVAISIPGGWPRLTDLILQGSESFSIVGNRIEDGGTGIYLQDSGFSVITGNNFDKIQAISTQTTFHLSISGNRSNDPLFTTNNIIQFAGSNSDIQMSGNNWVASNNCVYEVTAGSTVSGYFADQPAVNPFCDNYSASQIAPLLGGTNLDRVPYVTEPLTSSTFAAPNFDLGKNFQFVLQNSCTSGSPCLIPNPVNQPLPLNQHGFYQIINSPNGGAVYSADTLYSPFTTPAISVQPVSITTVPYVVQQNGIAFQAPITVQNSAGAANILTGGAGMTSGWSATHSTLANAVGGCVDPNGGSACSTLTESNDSGSDNNHQISQVVSQLGAATYSGFVNAGTPNVSSSITATFSSTGNQMTVTAVGSGTVARGEISCSCDANGLFVVGLNSGTGGTGTYFTSSGVTISSPTAVQIKDWRYLALTIDDGGSNSAAIGFDPNTGTQVDALSGQPSFAGNSHGSGIFYGGYAIPEAGGWYFVSMTYTLGATTATRARLQLGQLGQSNTPTWLDYPGTGGGFLQLWKPQLVPLSPAPTGITTIPGALSLPALTGGAQTKCLGLDASNNAVSSAGACGSGGGGSVSLTAAGAGLTLSPSTITGTGTLGLTNVSSTPHEWFNSVVSNALVATQPAFSDMSGQASLAQLPTLSANTVLGALTNTTPSGLTVPGCVDSAGNHLNWTSGTGFSCGTTSSSGGPVVGNVLTDGASITVPAVTGFGAVNTLTITGAGHTIQNPASFASNQYLTFVITENGVGGFTPTFAGDYAFASGSPVFNTTAGAVNIVSCVATSVSVMNCLGPISGITLSGNNAWTGNETHTGTESFQATIAITDTLTISTATFTPVLTSGINQQMTLIHASCPCTVANPTGIASVPGQTGMLDVIQSSTGSDTIGTWGSEYITPGGTAGLTLSTAANAIDHIPYRVIDSTHVLLGPVMLNAAH